MTTRQLRLSLLAFNFVIWGFVAFATVRLHHALQHKNDPVANAQGKYSQLDCHNQPGTHPTYVNVNGQPFFIACGVADTVNDPTPIAPPHDDPKLTGWIHVYGCPRATKADRTHVDTILVFSDGRIMHAQDGQLNDAQRAKLAAYIGETEGLNIIYDCGKAE
jgi:hypothetical protein